MRNPTILECPTLSATCDLSVAPRQPQNGADIFKHYTRIGEVLIQSYQGYTHIGANTLDIRLPKIHWLNKRGKLEPNYTGERVGNGTLLDFFLNRPEFLPETVFELLGDDDVLDIAFLGTIYRISSGNASGFRYWVRCLRIKRGGTIKEAQINICTHLRPNLRVALLKKIQHCQLK